MSNVSHETALKLEQAGMPHPKFADRQTWFDEQGFKFTAIEITLGKTYRLVGGRLGTQFWWGNEECDGVDGVPIVFAPSIDYIAKFLPENFILQMWDGRHSCKIDAIDTPIRTQADSFAEAAALAYLELNKDQ